jgi:hypothetical protein
LQIITKLINEFGTFESDVLDLTEDEYDLLKEASKEFWCSEPSFYFETKKGMVYFPAEIASKSILIIEKID